MFKQISHELKNHAPFTIFGAMTGIGVMLVFQTIPKDVSQKIFFILHPVHVLLSALVTASIYELHQSKQVSKKGFKGKGNFLVLLLIGYIGSIGIATISDSVIPYLGEILLKMPNRGIHLGFIEKWWLVNPLAAIGVAIAYFRPSTKFPHTGHVLLSTWASLFHILMAVGGALNGWSYIVVFAFLFLAVWAPCCLSDIVFPLLLVKEQKFNKKPS